MIPILYNKDETNFTSNGIGRLRDCISCVVTEERNGIYECDFEYPITGANFDKIQIGNIIGVTHDDSGDVQPFDIVSYSRPIDGVVTFHAVHISYRQSYITMTGGTINDLATALVFCKHGTNLGNDGNPFTYWTDKDSTGYCSAIGIIPRSVRSVLGGVEGSILDAYGGEYEWDKWTVRLYNARGQFRDFSIRYGVNMLDYEEDVDTQGTFSKCIPYWTDGTNTVVAGVITSNGTTVTNRDECVPLDLSERYETAPTQAQLESAALSYMDTNNTFIPQQSIQVEFVRLQDMGEFADYQNLLECNLCDTINVIFPDYNASGRFKIVKTVWDVLMDRYDSMELGSLSTTLAEALGVTSDSSSDVVDRYVNKTYPQYNLDTSAASGTDHDLYAAITALGWQSSVIV